MLHLEQLDEIGVVGPSNMLLHLEARANDCADDVRSGISRQSVANALRKLGLRKGIVQIP